jgi:Mrp family chromosome partitioning ATPase
METALPTFPLPGMRSAAEIAWTPAESKRRGVYGFDSLDPRSRSFNLMRAKLTDMQREHGWRLVGVVSATPSVGKSFIAANIASALSRSPRHQTYVVDVDLRRASLSSLFGLTPSCGIRTFLEEGSAATAPEVYRLEGESLLIMPTRAGPIHSAELLSGERAQALFRSMRLADPHHFFLFDLPPVFANDDALAAMTRMDSYIVVAEEGKTKQREIVETVGLLGREKLAGVILNKYRGGIISEGYGAGSYYVEGYGNKAGDK